VARTIMIMAGGTGGHVFPGLAVADYLRAENWTVVWMGSRAGIEARLVPTRGIEMAWVDFSGLRGKGPLAFALLPLRLLRAFWAGAKAILAHRPDVVLGLGGFQSFPGGMMAAFLGRPLVIHEQNSVAGLANRVLSHVADRVMTAFPTKLSRAVTIGNPVRADITAVSEPRARYAARSGPLRVLVMGGSQGAKAINEVVPGAIAKLPAASRPDIVHQTGRGHQGAVGAAYRVAAVTATSVEFIDDVAAALIDADVVICRAGALTVSELACAGVASILIPYPHAVDDHQTGNARYLSDAGAAVLLPQDELTEDRLAQLIGELSRETLAAMAGRARAMGKPDATRRLAEVCIEVAA
jgi:UDP-N-acetylglucosamine--N-acetylmuramyl-(pentapeptide) pyrophosphoryl-undecaprenol N-acetylglucosamine transferase